MPGDAEPPVLRWGILGASRFAARVIVPAMRQARGARAVAVASSDARRALAFAERLEIPEYYGAYEPLLHDPEIEAVYVGLRNADHALWAGRALEAGKHVLVERPASVNGFEATVLVNRARNADRLLQEGFGFRFHPQFAELCEVVRSGEIGEVRLVRASFSYALGRSQDFRWSRPQGGGALFDLGSSAVAAARDILAREPLAVSAQSFVGHTGVDEDFYGTLDCGDGVRAVFDVSLRGPGRQHLEVVGTKGALNAVAPWQPGLTDALYYVRGEARLAPGADQHRLMLEGFRDAVLGGRPRASLDDAMWQARALDALLRASRTGKLEPVE